MRFGKGVVTWGWGPRMEAALATVDRISWEVLGREGHVTSGRDGNHSANSLHYWRPGNRGQNPESIGAFDLRTWTDHTSGQQLSERRRGEYRDALARALGPEWDVVLEPTHIHVEHDPKSRGARLA